jgi:hypothetical protein
MVERKKNERNRQRDERDARNVESKPIQATVISRWLAFVSFNFTLSKCFRRYDFARSKIQFQTWLHKYDESCRRSLSHLFRGCVQRTTSQGVSQESLST